MRVCGDLDRIGKRSRLAPNRRRSGVVVASAVTPRIVTTMPATMIAVPVADTVQMERLTEFASDVLELADGRPDLELRELTDRLHADLLELKDEDR
jgi:hypothetical protein